MKLHNLIAAKAVMNAMDKGADKKAVREFKNRACAMLRAAGEDKAASIVEALE